MVNLLRKIYRYTYKFIFSKYDVLIEKDIRNDLSILDVGCGSYSPIQTFGKNKHRVGVDAFEPSIEISRRKRLHDEYVLCDVLDIDKHFDPDSFDVVMALDVIEHLEKQSGYLLIEKMEKIAKHKVIFYTPNGFQPQGDRDKNPWQVHLSGWTAEEFQSLGYKVYGINGVKPLRGEYAKVKYKPAFFWNFISDITEIFVKNKPGKAFQILAIKTKQQHVV